MIVLLAEDDSGARETLARLIEAEGHGVQAAPDGTMAWEMFQRFEPDLVLSDLHMPGMSGIDLAEVIHHERPDLPIVLCSGRVTDEDRSRAEQVGVHAFLGKPFATHQLADVMARSLGADGTRH